MRYNRFLSLPPLIIALLVVVFALGSFPVSAQLTANPTPTQPPRDLDGDGVADVNDACPQHPGPAENNGCPITPTAVPDTDGDGLLDTDDLCPTVAGPRENRGCPIEPTTVPDTDGDSISDTDDLCPTVAGSPENRGCPLEVIPTATPIFLDTESNAIVTPTGIPQITPTIPPATLPVDGCYVTPKSGTVNVRANPNLGASAKGRLFFGSVYEAQGAVSVGAMKWLALTDYEYSVGVVGYALATTLNYSGTCPVLPYPSGGIDWFISRETIEVSERQHPTIKYCVVQEVEEAGNMEQVCYQVEIPEGCVVASNEAGEFTVDCGAGEVKVGPPFEDMPADGIQVPVRDSEIGVTLQIIVYAQPANNPSMVEHCLSQETGERGKFQQVCYEMEVPEGCWMEQGAEAGVFTLQCRPEIGGEASFTFEQREDDGVGVIVRHSLPTLPTLLMPTFRDCNQDGVDDINGCAFDLAVDDGETETNKETEGWWREVLDLTCPGDWIIVLGTDYDGEEVVTDAQCVDWDE